MTSAASRFSQIRQAQAVPLVGAGLIAAVLVAVGLSAAVLVAAGLIAAVLVGAGLVRAHDFAQCASQLTAGASWRTPARRTGRDVSRRRQAKIDDWPLPVGTANHCACRDDGARDSAVKTRPRSQNWDWRSSSDPADDSRLVQPFEGYVPYHGGQAVGPGIWRLVYWCSCKRVLNDMSDRCGLQPRRTGVHVDERARPLPAIAKRSPNHVGLWMGPPSFVSRSCASNARWGSPAAARNRRRARPSPRAPNSAPAGRRPRATLAFTL